MRATFRWALFTAAASIFVSTKPCTAQFFQTPEPVDIDVHSVDYSAALSSDGREIFFTHWVSDTDWDIHTASRNSISDAWSRSEPVSDLINTGQVWKDGVTLSDDGLNMIFGSQRRGGKGGWDLWQTTRSAIGGDWTDPINLETINSSGGESTPSLSKDGLTLYFGSGCCGEIRPPVRSSDIWVSTRETTNSAWSIPVHLDAINYARGIDAYPSISRDGLSLYLMSLRPGSYGAEDIYISTRKSVNDAFGKPLNLGPVINGANADFSPYISTDGTLYFTANVIRGVGPWLLWQAAPRNSMLGDFNADSLIDVNDLDVLTDAIFRIRDVVGTDLNQDSVFNFDDVSHWVEQIKRTWFGDANLDGEFNSSDLTLIFQAGGYEDTLSRNSTWASGDWNGDREFNSSDLVLAFQEGGYEQGPRPVLMAVPEPASMTILIVGMLGIVARGRSRFIASQAEVVLRFADLS